MTVVWLATTTLRNALRHEDEGKGGFKTVTAIAKSENEDSIKAFVKKHITEGTIASADENRSYDVLYASYKMERVNHEAHRQQILTS